MKFMRKCVFCNYQEEQAIVYKDKLCYAVIIHRPINKHHVLVIPAKHYKNFVELSDKLAGHIFIVAKRISKAVGRACRLDAIEHISDDDLSGIGINLEEHYKFHIIPRFKKDKVKIDWHRTADPGLKVRAQYAKDVHAKLSSNCELC